MKSKFYFFDSDALKNFHKRIFFSITIFFFVYLIAFYRIFDVMILDSEIIEKQNSSQIIERGKIYDRNGNLLSSTIRSYALSVNPKKIKTYLHWLADNWPDEFDDLNRRASEAAETI